MLFGETSTVFDHLSIVLRHIGDQAHSELLVFLGQNHLLEVNFFVFACVH